MKILPHSQLSRPTRRKLIKLGLIAAPSIAVGLRSKRADAAFASFMAHSGASGTPLRHAVSTTAYPQNYVGTTQGMSIQPLTARVNMSTVLVVIPLSYGEGAIGGTTTVQVYIQDASNNLTLVTFSGSAFGTASGVKYIISDEVTLTAPITSASIFNARIWMSNTANQIPINTNWANYQTGGTLVYGTTVANICNSTAGQGASTYYEYGLCPMVVATRHSGRAVALYGDSVCYGFGEDSPADGGAFAPNSGLFAPALSGTIPTANYGCPGDSVQGFVNTSNSARAAMGAYFTSFATNYGVNDFGRTAAQIIADRQTMAGMLSSYGPLIQATMTPRNFSTDNYATSTGQTAGPGNRDGVNAWVISQTPHIDFRFALEYDPIGHSGIIKSPGAVDFSLPGIVYYSSSLPWQDVHPTGGGYAACNAVVSPSLFS